MFLILNPDEPQVPPAPPAVVESYDRAVPAPREPVIDEAAVDRVVDLILGDSPHSARKVAGTAMCLTCRAEWPCGPTIRLIVSAGRGKAAVEAAEGTWLDGAR